LYESHALIDVDTDDEVDDESFEDFNAELNWCHGIVPRTIDRMQMHVKIGAPQKELESAYAAIRSMVKSDMVFREKNLHTLAFFLLRVGPVLDAMAGPGRSTRLTRLLKALKRNPNERTCKQEYDIDAVCGHLGRDTFGVIRRQIRDEEEGGISLLI
jgi:hypothetical protein